jgi:site-specific recombinase XerD
MINISDGSDYEISQVVTLDSPQLRNPPFATLRACLLENGTDLRIIQELLGHKSSKTTDSKRSGEPRSAIYTLVSQRLKQNVPNPLDQLGL